MFGVISKCDLSLPLNRERETTYRYTPFPFTLFLPLSPQGLDLGGSGGAVLVGSEVEVKRGEASLK